MKRFLYSLGSFLIIVLCMLLVILFLPTTPSASQSLLYSSIQKDSLLRNTPQPRIILLGGSNIAYGINSQLIKDSLGLNPIDASIHASLGLKFMLDHIEPFLIDNDTLIIVSEYEHFYGSNAYGGDQLLRMVLDVSYRNIKYLNTGQILSIVELLPSYLKSKVKIDSYIKYSIPPCYRYNAFNEYGDAYLHWDSKKLEYFPANRISEKFNDEVFSYLLNFIDRFNKRNIMVYVSYPGLQDLSFDIYMEQIREVQTRYKGSNLVILGTPENYSIPDSLTYDTPYHLIKGGVNYRTNSLIRNYINATRK